MSRAAINNKQIIPEGYKKTAVGIIPEEWEDKRFGTFSLFFSGGTPNTANQEHFQGNIPFIKSGEIDKTQTEHFINEGALKESSAKIVTKGDLLFALYGANSGDVAISKIEGAINQAILCIRPKANKFYIKSFLELNKERLVAKYLQGGQGNLSAKIVKHLHIPFPPQKEQEKISQILSTWNEAIEKTQRLIDQLKYRKRGLAQHLLTRRKRLSGFNGEWIKTRVGDIFQIENRHISWDDNAYYNLVSVRRRYGGLFFRSSISAKEIQVKKLKEIKLNDFLISKRQVSHGAWSVVPKEFDSFLVSDEYDCLSIVNTNVLSSNFWRWFCQQPKMTNYAFLDSKGVHIEKLIFHFSQFRKRKLKIPESLAEQEAIASILDEADKELQLYEKKLTTLKVQKKGLMQKLLTGEVRVKT
jgi:type I restriction enzyme S subunit